MCKIINFILGYVVWSFIWSFIISDTKTVMWLSLFFGAIAACAPENDTDSNSLGYFDKKNMIDEIQTAKYNYADDIVFRNKINNLSMSDPQKYNTYLDLINEVEADEQSQKWEAYTNRKSQMTDYELSQLHIYETANMLN